MIKDIKMCIIDRLIHPKEEDYRQMEVKKLLFNILVRNRYLIIPELLLIHINRIIVLKHHILLVLRSKVTVRKIFIRIKIHHLKLNIYRKDSHVNILVSIHVNIRKIISNILHQFKDWPLLIVKELKKLQFKIIKIQLSCIKFHKD